MSPHFSKDNLEVFISYSRRDMAVVDALATALNSRGFKVLIDRRSLPFGERWPAELSELIRRCDTVVWVISTDSVQSKWVNWELDEVAKRAKRLVPVIIDDTPRAGLPRQLGEINILPSEGSFDLTRDLELLVEVLNTDYFWLKEGSRLSDRAHEWLTGGRNAAFLLRGSSLRAAEHWIERRPVRARPVSQEVLDLLLASRQGATKRQRTLISALAIAGLIFVGIAAIAVSQLYRVEMGRWLANAQLMSRRQPTEALLALAAVKNHWFADPSVMAQMSPQLVEARLTIARHTMPDSAQNAGWGARGAYVAASASGHAYIWSSDHTLISGIPPRRAASVDEKQGFGEQGRVPLSAAWAVASGKLLATRDWRGCLRVFETANLKDIDETDPKTQTCLNVITKGGTDFGYFPADIREDGAVVLVRDGSVQLDGHPIPIPTFLEGTPTRVDLDMQDRVLLIFDDKLAILHRGAATVLPKQVNYGRCDSGTRWSAGVDGTLTLIAADGISKAKLAGKSPWLVSNGCTLYLDGEGSLYRIGASSAPIQTRIADAWQYSGNARKTAFSRTDRYVAVSSNDGSIIVHDLDHGTNFELLGHTQRVFSMAFDDTETQLLTASNDQSVRVFSLRHTISRVLGLFPEAEEVYSAAAGGSVASSAKFDYSTTFDDPPASPNTVPELPGGAQVAIRQDWKIGTMFVVADGDTQIVAICKTAACPDESIVRKFNIDFTNHGTNVAARVSSDGAFVAVVEEGSNLHFFDLRKAGNAPLLSLADGAIKSAAFDARAAELYVLSGDKLRALPFGPAEIARRLRELVHICLTNDERDRLSDGGGWQKLGRGQICSSDAQ